MPKQHARCSGLFHSYRTHLTSLMKAQRNCQEDSQAIPCILELWQTESTRKQFAIPNIIDIKRSGKADYRKRPHVWKKISDRCRLTQENLPHRAFLTSRLRESAPSRPKTTAATIAESVNQQNHCSTITAAINETVTRACFVAQNANRTKGRHIRPVLCMEGKVKIAIPKIPYGSIPALRFFFKI